MQISLLRCRTVDINNVHVEYLRVCKHTCMHVCNKFCNFPRLDKINRCFVPKEVNLNAGVRPNIFFSSYES
jgi:hypothetical protein